MPRAWRFSVIQLLMMTVLAALLAGVYANSWHTQPGVRLDSIQFSPSGEQLAVYSDPHCIDIWRLSDAKARRRSTIESRVIGTQGRPVIHFDFLDEDHLLWVGIGGGVPDEFDVRHWDLKAERVDGAFLLPHGDLGTEFNWQGKNWLEYREDGRGVQRSLETGEPLRTIDVGAPSYPIFLSDDGDTAAVYRLSQRARWLEFWDLPSGELRSRLQLRPDAAAAGVLSPDGRKYFSVDPPTSIVDTATGETLAELDSSGFNNLGHEFSLDGTLLAVNDNERALLIDVATGGTIRTFAAPRRMRESSYMDLAFSPDGKTLAAATYDGEIEFRDVATGRLLYVAGERHVARTILIYTASFIVWGIVWGRMRRRGMWKRTERVRRVHLMTHRRALLVLGVLLSVPTILTVLFVMRGGLRSPIAYLPLATLGLLFGIVAFRIVGPAIIGRLVGQPYWLQMRRAQRLVARPAGERTFGVIQVMTFDPVDDEMDVAEAMEMVRRRFAQVIGRPVEFRRRGLVVVFPQTSQYIAYHRLQIEISGFMTGWLDSELLICRELMGEWLTDHAQLLRTLLAMQLIVQEFRFHPPPWLMSGLAALIAAETDETDEADMLSAAHRAVRAELSRSPIEPIDALLQRSPGRSLAMIAEPDRRRSDRRTLWHMRQTMSLTAFLLDPSNPNRRERFQTYMQQLTKRDRATEKLERELGASSADLVNEWRAWIDRQDVTTFRAPPPFVRQWLIERTLPIVLDAERDVDRRCRMIRKMGMAGWGISVPPLIELLSDRSVDVRTDALWALQRISGNGLWNADIARWREWAESLPAEARMADAETAQWRNVSRRDATASPFAPAMRFSPTTDDAEVLLAQVVSGDPVDEQRHISIADAGSPFASTAAAAERTDGDSMSCRVGDAVPKRPHREADETRRPPAHRPPILLRVVWWLMIVGGPIAIVISLTNIFDALGVWRNATLRGSDVYAAYLLIAVRYIALLGGVRCIVKGFGGHVDGLKSTSLLQTFMIPNCDPINMCFGLASLLLLRAPSVRVYLLDKGDAAAHA